jgi:hypothetical protein
VGCASDLPAAKIELALKPVGNAKSICALFRREIAAIRHQKMRAAQAAAEPEEVRDYPLACSFWANNFDAHRRPGRAGSQRVP